MRPGGRSSGAVCAVVLALCGIAAGAPAAEPGTWYAQRLTGGDTPLRVEHFWSKGRKLRSETVIGGIPVVTIVAGDTYTVIDPLRQTGIAVRRSPQALRADKERPNERPFGGEARRLLADGAEKVRSESLAGRPCDVYRLTDRFGRREAWITQDDLQLPIRVEGLERTSGGRIRNDYVDWARELPIPDSFFEPDPRVQLERIEYDEYLKRSAEGPVGPAPILHSELFHGR